MYVPLHTTVLYSPCLGTEGLDPEVKVSREEVYLQEKFKVGSVDVPFPWYPEVVEYRISSITVGN